MDQPDRAVRVDREVIYLRDRSDREDLLVREHRHPFPLDQSAPSDRSALAGQPAP